MPSCCLCILCSLQPALVATKYRRIRVLFMIEQIERNRKFLNLAGKI